MTISSETRKAGPFSGNDVTTSFPFTFKVFSTSDIEVTLTDSSSVNLILTEDSDYTVTLNADQDVNPGGTIDYPVSGDPLATGETLTIDGDLAYTQETSIPNNSAFFASTVEDMFDYATILIQQLKEISDRTPRFRVNSNVDQPEIADMVAGQYLRANNTGDGLEFVTGSLSSDMFLSSGTGAVTRTISSKLAETISVMDFWEDGVTTDAEAIIAALAYAKTINIARSTPMVVYLPAIKNWDIDQQINIDSAYNLSLYGWGGMPICTWTGTTMNTVTQDNDTGAMFLLGGNDHAFAGIKDIFIDCASKANFPVRVSGTTNTPFVIQRLKIKAPQLDCIYYGLSGTKGPVQWEISDIAIFPATSFVFGGINAVCGRYPINLNINSSAGEICLKNITSDTGASGWMLVTASTFAGCNIRLDNCRVENYKPSCDIIKLDYGPAVTIGSIILNNFKWADSSGTTSTGSTSSVIRNITVADTTPQIHWDCVQTLNSSTYLYKHDANATKTVTYDAKRFQMPLRIGDSSKVLKFPTGTAFPSTPIKGEYFFNSSTNYLNVYNGTSIDVYTPTGNYLISGPVTTLTVTSAYLGYMIHTNNSSTSVTITMDTIANLGIGFYVRFVTGTNIAITINTSGGNIIGAGSATSLASTAAIGNTLTLVSVHPGRFLATSQTGSWS